MNVVFTKKILIAMVVTCLVLPSTVLAWTAYEKNIKVRFAQIVLSINGKKIETKAEPFIYNGDVYAPVATIANALNVKWEWDNHIPAVSFYDRDFQILEENYSSGYLQAYPLGNDYFYYNDIGIIEIRKGLKHQDDNSFALEIPVVSKPGYEMDGHFDMPIKKFMDIDQDGMKQELLMTHLLLPGDGESEAGSEKEFHLNIIKLIGDDKLVLVDSILVDIVPSNSVFNILYYYDDHSKQLDIKYYSIDEPDKLLKIKVYEWQEDHFEKVAELANIQSSEY